MDADGQGQDDESPARSEGAPMRYTTAGLGRVLVIRLDDGDVVHESVEAAARAEGIARAAVLLLGGADTGSRVVVGPKDGRSDPIVPMERLLEGVHEAAGVGTLFPDAEGQPVLHLHAAFGRDDRVTAGCIRRGVLTWIVGEVVVIELTGSEASRRLDEASGFELLEP
jgi:predicted DNA-binding protein with PD1-like motif